jgi:hypothetical protein
MVANASAWAYAGVHAGIIWIGTSALMRGRTPALTVANANTAMIGSSGLICCKI